MSAVPREQQPGVVGQTGEIHSALVGLICVRCSKSFDGDRYFEGCPACSKPNDRANLVTAYDYGVAARSFSPEALEARRDLGLWRWAELLPVTRPRARVTLGEGNTPLLSARHFGFGHVLLKDESRNPTWSYKDRLAAVAVSRAVESGARVVAASSSGNHGAAAAAYSARAGLPCVIFTRRGVPTNMRALMQAYGALVFATADTGDDRWSLVRSGVRNANWYPLSNYTSPPTGNPYGADGYKTIAYEVCQQLRWQSPGTVVVPTGFGEGLSGIWRGFVDLRRLGIIDALPSMIAAETASAGPLARAIRDQMQTVPTVETTASIAFSINTSTSGLQALQALRESDGRSVQVADAEILGAQEALGRSGLFVEASAATGLAAVSKSRRMGEDLREPIVVMLTSSGLKDPRPIIERAPEVPNVSGIWEELLPHLPSRLRLATDAKQAQPT